MPRSNASSAVRLVDIADDVGTSVQVVSKVLNGGSSTVGVSEALRRRVIEAAQRLDYRRNAAALALRRQRFGSVGVLMGSPDGQVFLPQRLTAGLVQALSAADHGCVLVNGGPLDNPAVLQQRLLAERMVDALIIASVEDPPAVFVKAIRRLAVPVVWLHRSCAYNAVAYDEAHAAESLVDHLADRGWAAVTYLDLNGRRPGSAAQRDRLLGFHAACRRRRLKPTLELDDRVPRPDRRDYFRAWLAARPGPTAVVCDSASSAAALTGTACDRGRTIPDDLAIATFDDGGIVTAVAPTLTAAITPELQAGRAAAEMALDLAAAPTSRRATRLVRSSLQPGQST
jgi:LacI family transcriptional regulator